MPSAKLSSGHFGRLARVVEECRNEPPHLWLLRVGEKVADFVATRDRDAELPHGADKEVLEVELQSAMMRYLSNSDWSRMQSPGYRTFRIEEEYVKYSQIVH